MFLLIFSHIIGSIIHIIPYSIRVLRLKNMIFNAKNRKTVERIWAVIAVLVIFGMVGFTLIALIQ